MAIVEVDRKSIYTLSGAAEYTLAPNVNRIIGLGEGKG
jgi:hypothetical protein